VEQLALEQLILVAVPAAAEIKAAMEVLVLLF
jgi:hypothetical protein